MNRYKCINCGHLIDTSGQYRAKCPKCAQEMILVHTLTNFLRNYLKSEVRK